MTVQMRMCVVHRHSRVAMAHLRLPIRERHTDLLPERGVSVAERVPTQARHPQGDLIVADQAGIEPAFLR